ncbi:cytochrome P450 [Saccharothrix algeriensis]|uniref:Cytochrome P450 n=3 Tax=Saccharothrix algeriensis TaxID=173560 RepID=A0ABS2SFT2_9PSEU|nr:cytochrome P450 [Saccharothrix algeriensis]MBM7814834.1 cytochrome P450 [Saccharothrix algeriensis]
MRDPRRALAAEARSGNGVVELGPGAWLVTEPVATERLLADEHALTARAEQGAATAWGTGGLERWTAARQAMRPELTGSAVARFAPVIAAHARRAATGWASAEGFDVVAEAARLMSAVNTHCLLDGPAPLLARLVGAELSAAERAWSPLRRRRLLRAQSATLTAVREHLHARAPRSGPVAALAGAGLDDRTTALAVRTMLLSSHHVPAAALAWALHELSLRPDVQARVRAEAGARPDPADLPLCRAVVREALRLHPPVWQLRRVLDAPVLGFPAGADLLFSPWVNHRDPAAHPDPDRFDPWRRRPASPGSYLPFALGPRFCPGSRLATAELVVVLATVLRTHRVVPRRAPAPARGVLNAPRGLRLALVPDGPQR